MSKTLNMSTGTRTMENITIKHYYGDTLCDGATVARKHRLYVTNWWMFQEYKKAMSAINPTKNKDKLISIAYLAGVPVACSLTDSRPLTQLFVRKALRRQGIGSKLFDEHWKWWTENVQTYYKYFQPTVYIGVDGSEKFWQYMGMEVVSNMVD